MKKVYEARDLAEAELVKGMIESEEIEVIVQDGALQGVLGETAVSSEALPTVWVNDEDIARAQVIVNEFKQGGPATEESQFTWTCPKCGEVLQGQFTTCWNCGTERPATV